MTLLREIQVAATDGNIDIATVLRKAAMLATRLRNAAFRELVNRELNGYENNSNLPPYRIVPVTVRAHIRSLQYDWPSAPVFTEFLPEKLKSWGESCHLRQPIAALASMVKQGGESGQLQVNWPQGLAYRYGAKGYNEFECLAAWQIVDHNSLVGLVDTVRNRILEFALQIESENPDAGEAASNTQPVAPEKLQPLVQNMFYGPVGNVAQNSEHFSQMTSMGIQKEDLRKLVAEIAAHFDELNLDARQKQRAEVQISALNTELAGEPDSEIVRQAGHTLRNIIEGAIGSLLATAATQPRVWPWIHQMLEQHFR